MKEIKREHSIYLISAFTLCVILGIYLIASDGNVIVAVPQNDSWVTPNTSEEFVRLAGCIDCNVVLITLDTVRADHLGCYGYKQNTTPNIDRLAEKSIVFDRAFTTAPITLTSHTSILTGEYPFQHGVRDNGNYYLNESVESIAGIFSNRGFSTAAFVGSFILDSMFGLDRGFSVYDDTMPPSTKNVWQGHEIEGMERKAETVSESALKWVDKNFDKKFFVWIHYFDAHHPYRPPERYKALFNSSGNDSDVNSYDGEIAYVDEQIGRVLDNLANLGLMNTTIIVIVADHGEGLGEHGEATHGSELFDTTLRVPLIIYVPKMSGGKIVDGESVRTVDIAPTILNLEGINYSECMVGKDLFNANNDTYGMVYSETYLGERDTKGNYCRSIRAEDWKYIHCPKRADALYNLTYLSGESKNLIDDSAEAVSNYRAYLDEFITTYSVCAGVGGNTTLDDESKSKLRSLGYLN